jgi:multimeric flavodoxin WrbA
LFCKNPTNAAHKKQGGKMKILIHDRKDLDCQNILKDTFEEIVAISDNGKIQPCICCYACWVKTPGQCAINDGYGNMGELVSKCNRLIIISQCYYGGFGPFVKNVLDRSVCPYLLPYFKTRRGETHHPKRYKNKIVLSVHFYGNIAKAEKETAMKLVRAYGNNLFHKTDVSFYDSFEKIQGV